MQAEEDYLLGISATRGGMILPHTQLSILLLVIVLI